MLLLSVLLSYKIPHDSYSVAQYIIKPIRNEGGGVFYPSSLIPLTIGLIGIIEFVNLERFANKSKILITLLALVIIIPLMKWSIDFTRTNYYWIRQDHLNAVDIEDPHISLSSINNKVTINMAFDLKDYSRSKNEFKIRVYLPKSLSEFSGIKTYESEKSYLTYGNRNKLSVDESIVIDSNKDINQIFDSKWYREDVIYELYNEDEVIRIIEHGQ